MLAIELGDELFLSFGERDVRRKQIEAVRLGAPNNVSRGQPWCNQKAVNGLHERVELKTECGSEARLWVEIDEENS